MRRLRPEIVHFFLPGPYLIGAPVAIAAGVPVKVMSRRSLSLYQQNWPLSGLVERRLHAKMDAVIGNSRAVVRELIAEGIPEAKVSIIYNGIEAIKLPDRAKARAALGLDQDSLVGIIVANLIPYKGHRDLIEGLAHVLAQISSPWRILAAGRDQGLRAELEAFAREKGVSGRIQFIGEREDVPSLLAAADFGVLTSREEGFSNVILEGMAAGLPMVVTDVGGNPEAVVDGETGLVVPAGNPQAIGEAILRVARDAALRKRLGTAGRARVEKEFSIGRCVRLHAALYQDLLERHDAEAGGIAAE
jgi:glycosyltransferase involved in cell wall biosynthesis